MTICAKCGQEITGSVLNADGASFHPECFTCDGCGANLTSVYKKDGKRLCADCALPKCEICKKSISGPAMNVGGKSFHPECFVCAGCHNPLTSYFDVDGKFMCKGCAETAQNAAGAADATRKICRKCKKPIVGKMVLGDKDDPFHPECFVCDECGVELDEFVIDPNRRFKFQESRYLCKSCGGKATEIAENKTVKKCCVCGEPCAAEGPDAEKVLHLLDGSTLHLSCFKCNTCGAVRELNGPAMTNRLLRTQVEKLKKGTYQCDKCFHGAESNLPDAPEIKQVSLSLAHGAYLGKQMDERTFLQVAYLVKLLEGGRCSFDRRESGPTPHTAKYGSRWVAEGTYTEDKDDSGHVTAIRFTVAKQSSEVGATELVMEVQKGSTNSVLICDGVTCPLQLGVPDYELEQMMKPPERQAAPKPVPKAKSEETETEKVFCHVTSGTVMERPAAPAHGIIMDEAKEVAPASALPSEVPEGFLSLEELRDVNIWKPRGVDPAKREEYLSEGAFAAVFGMSKEDFAKLPGWKKNKLKKDHGLF